MLKIRLQRLGRKKRPNYRVVVAEHTSAVSSKYIDQLGYFDPLISKDGLKVDTDRLLEWIKKGAKPTNTVARLLKGSGFKGMEPFIIEMKDKKKKKEEEEKPAQAPVAEAPAEPASEAETPAEAPAEPAPEAETPAEAPAEPAPEAETPAEAPAEEKPEA